jgi:hypothetical protein
MAYSLNKTANVNELPKIQQPRTIYHFKGNDAVKHFMTAAHGRLVPFCCYPVKPNDTWLIDTAVYVKMDTSIEVPLDDIQCTLEYYYAPFRILAPNFKKVVGDKDPDDNTVYSLPQTYLDFNIISATDHKLPSFILPHLGYGLTAAALQDSGIYISSMPLVMYAKIWNHNYRDTLLQNNIPYENIIDNTTAIHVFSSTLAANLDGLFFCQPVNRTHDFFADGFKSPNLEGDISINLGNPIKIDTQSQGHSIGTSSGAPLRFAHGGTGFTNNNNVKIKSTGELNTTSAATGNDVWGTNLIAPTDSLTINQLLMAFALYNYQFRTQSFGTHYDDWLYAHFSLQVSMSLIDEPECLASAVTTLNMMPVLNQGSDSSLGNASGMSASLFKGASVNKSFVEHGYIIGLMCFRVAKHTYSQGYNPHVWDLKDQLDLPLSEFLNIGRVTNPMSAIFNNTPSVLNRGSFNFINAYDEFRKFVNRSSGLFAPYMSTYSSAYVNFFKHYTYQDVYASAPTFSGDWLLEDPNNVKRTLSGRLIPNAADTTNPYSQQYLIEVVQNITVSQVMPGEPVPAHLVNRLR